MKLGEFCQANVFYFIGIGGVSMSGLAKLILRNGGKVLGYDRARNEHTGTLSAMGVKIAIGDEEDESNLFASTIVVYSDAIQEKDKRLLYARGLNKTIYRRPLLLKKIASFFQETIGIAGSHGKTTCTAMCSHVLDALNEPFFAHIGGEDCEFGNFRFTGERFFLSELCEYKKNMLTLRPKRAVLLNVDLDHMECYDGEEDIVESFASYCKNASIAFTNADDERSMRFGRDFTTFSIENQYADYVAEGLKGEGERYSFSVREYGKIATRIDLQVVGRCHIYNALGTFACMRSFGFPVEKIAEGLRSFWGVKRRFERVGEYHGIHVVCDYAHHPKELLFAIETAKKLCKGKLCIVFQPHTFSRTRLLMEEFVALLRGAENVMVYKTYPARERYDEEGSGETLARKVGCLYADNVKQLAYFLKGTFSAGDTALFLGAGDIYQIARYLVRDFQI